MRTSTTILLKLVTSQDITDTQWVHCIPTCAGVGGGWRRIANIDISTGGDCPSGWHKDIYSGDSFCHVVSDAHPLQSCSSTNFSANGTSYQRVCVVEQEQGRIQSLERGGGTLLKKVEEQKKKKKKKVATIIASYPLPNIFYHICYVK